mmetsp:Transcript_136630/g.323695  ORF Transcript_136630/g.323695 Transcript_136630/m.323695 type:complete len:514 (-) Transcript_136630:14-1555(-)
MLGLARRMFSSFDSEDKQSSSPADQAEPSEAGPKLPLASRHLRFEAGAQSSENDKEVSEPPGLASPTGAETPGSRHHGGGECNPCAWYWKPQGCLRGKECGYCHLCPEGEVKLRKKAKLAAMRGGASPTSPSPFSASSPKLGKEDSEAEVPDRKPAPSVGSALHGTGECKPCAWFWKPKGCQNGAECRHCHLCPMGEIRQRKKAKDKHAKEDEQADVSWNLPMSVPLEPLKVDLPEARALDLPDMPGNLQEPQKVAPSPTSALGGDSVPTFKPPPGLDPSPVASIGLAETPAKLKAESSPEKFEDTCTPMALSLSDMLSPDGSGEDSVTPLRLSDYIGAKPFTPSKLLEGLGEQEAFAPAKLKVESGHLEKLEDSSTPMALSLSEMLSPEASEEDGVTPLRLSDYIPEHQESYAFGLLEGDASLVLGAEQEARVFPSEGSRLHGTGLCRPCAWFWKPKGCENGDECRHCHLCPQEEIKNRRKAKHLMMQCDQSMSSSWNAMMWAAPQLPVAQL